MFTARSLATSISLAALSVSLLRAQGVKPSDTGAIQQRPTAIQELDLQAQRFLGSSPQAYPVSTPLIDSQSLSRYRGFQLGMNVLEVTKRADLRFSEARVIHQRPAVIQELDWRSLRPFDSSGEADPVKEILFSFYNGQLFRMVIDYDQTRTQGLSDEGMIEAISAKYGRTTRPAEKIILFSSFQVYNDSEKILARWEDSQFSWNLFRSSYEPVIGMVVFSKRLDALARAAIVESIRLDEQEARQRENERHKKPDQKDRAAQQNVRLVNKTTFRP
jgi:hypothetical protein